MNADEGFPLPPAGSLVLTACNGRMRFERNTPATIYRGQRIYFCLDTCKLAFEADPKTSCLAGNASLESPPDLDC